MTPSVMPTMGEPPPGIYPPESGGGIFNDPGETNLTTHETSTTSPLNLLSQVENWNIGTGTAVQDVILTIDVTTGAQLQKLLRGLPDGFTYALSLRKED